MWRLRAADWSVLRDGADIAVFQDHLADPDAVIERLLSFDVVFALCASGPRCPANVIERLPNLKLHCLEPDLKRVDPMSPLRPSMGSQWFTRV